MSFRVIGLDAEPFRPLYSLSDDELRARGARRYLVDAKPGFPDRIELRDLEPGETALLVNWTHQPAPTPYRASHAVFVREGAEAAVAVAGAVPEPLRLRPLSLRAFDALHMMIAAELVAGRDAEGAALRLLADPNVAYLHAHYAAPGCYAARIERA